MRARCTHYHGVCDHLVCPRETEKRASEQRAFEHLEDLIRKTRGHGMLCPCKWCRELRAL